MNAVRHTQLNRKPGHANKLLFIAGVLFVVLIGYSNGQTPRTAEDYNNRGLDRQNKGDIDGAIEDYTKAISLKGKSITLATAYNNRANARMSKNDLDGAIEDYSKAIEIQPDNFEN